MIDFTHPNFTTYNIAIQTLSRIHTLYTTKCGLLTITLTRPGDKPSQMEARVAVREYAIKEVNYELRRELRTMRQYFDALESVIMKDDILL